MSHYLEKLKNTSLAQANSFEEIQKVVEIVEPLLKEGKYVYALEVANDHKLSQTLVSKVLFALSVLGFARVHTVPFNLDEMKPYEEFAVPYATTEFEDDIPIEDPTTYDVIDQELIEPVIAFRVS